VRSLSRKQSRGIILQILYQIDVGKMAVDEATANVLNDQDIKAKELEYIKDTISGVINNLPTIDKAIKENAIDWNIERMAKVDKNILRYAVYELLYSESVPQSVAINEGVELTKVFSSPESGKFINGILGKVVRLKEQDLSK
jgi:transcription antitermination protein NusB